MKIQKQQTKNEQEEKIPYKIKLINFKEIRFLLISDSNKNRLKAVICTIQKNFGGTQER
jgi:hypothetical protein